ncbi:MAG: hypothetical protein Q9165_007150 [Trypethelium subeluteriae]
MLLNLPSELRALVYDFLLPPNALAHPVRSLALTSVSHRPPSISFLLVCRTLTEELLSHYYRKATFKLVLSHTFNFYRVDPVLDNLSRHPVLQRIEIIELVFFCDGILVRDYPSFGPEKACQEVRRRAKRAVEVLEGATALKKVKVSWVDPGGHWGTRSDIVRPVRALSKRGVLVEVGEVLGVEEVKRNSLMRALKTEVACEITSCSDAKDIAYLAHSSTGRDHGVDNFISIPWILMQTEQSKLSPSEPSSSNAGLVPAVFIEQFQRPQSPSSRY